MIMQLALQSARKSELGKLCRRRECLRRKLKRHFSLPVDRRDYTAFEAVVDELDALRKRAQFLKNNS